MVIERGRTLQNVGVSIAGHASRKPWNVYSSPPLDEAEPADVQRGVADKPVAARATVLADASTAHPERFPAGRPHQPARPVEVRINPPTTLLPLSESSNPRPLPLADAGAFA